MNPRIHQHVPEFKLVLAGDGGVDKRGWIEKLVENDDVVHDYEKKFEAGSFVRSYEVHSLTFFTNRGPMKFNVWVSSADQHMYGVVRDRYYMQAHCAIIMCDLTSRITYKNWRNIHRDLKRLCGENIPTVLAGTNCDSENRKVKAKQIRGFSLPHFDMSFKTNHNLLAPLHSLMRDLTGDATVHILDKFSRIYKTIRENPDVLETKDNRHLADLFSVVATTTAGTADADDQPPNDV